MELKQIKELIAAMGRSDLSELTIKEGPFEIQLKRPQSGSQLSAAALYTQDFDQPVKSLPSTATPSLAAVAPITPPSEVDQNSKFVTSPMVGTFYSAASPDDPAFIKVGDRVDAETVVCIVEAMKVMNEIKAGVSGVVAEVLIDNASPVEFGTKLMRVV